jgi:hypothetical protein
MTTPTTPDVQHLKRAKDNWPAPPSTPVVPPYGGDK